MKSVPERAATTTTAAEWRRTTEKRRAETEPSKDVERGERDADSDAEMEVERRKRKAENDEDEEARRRNKVEISREPMERAEVRVNEEDIEMGGEERRREAS